MPGKQDGLIANFIQFIVYSKYRSCMIYQHQCVTNLKHFTVLQPTTCGYQNPSRQKK
jgi:hypothetical protein